VDSSAGSSIAVLPFVDMSAARDQQYLSDGITEEILDRLAKTGQFRVIARTSSFAFRDRSVDIPQIAAVLDVTHVLEGSVRRAGDRVRVTAQLVDTASNSHVWSDTYDRNLGDLFAVQEEIAASVAAALQTRLSSTGSGRPPSASGAAYERFLQGQYFVNRRAPGDVERAIRDYEEAVAIDPGFARAWAALSGAYGLLAWESDPPDPWRARQFESARQAVRLDPGLVEGHVRLAKYYFEVSQLDESLQAVREAAALAPDDPWLAGFSDGFPDWTNSDAEAEVASERRRVELDPLSATARKDLGLRLFAAGRLDEASSEFRKALELSPNLGWDAQIEISRVLVAQGRYDDASLEIAQLPPGEPRDYGLALLCEDPGRRADAEAALGRLAARSGDFMHDLRLAELLVLRGRIDDAFVRLQSARDGLPRDQSLLARIWYLQNEMHVSPFLQPLHADPRWAALMANPG
jgi:serine/threonine-protein kinase